MRALLTGVLAPSKARSASDCSWNVPVERIEFERRLPQITTLRLRAGLTPTHRNITPSRTEPAKRSVSKATPRAWLRT